ncbi:MAG: hypothetical protein U1F52_21630 [Burkholderiales bacterium]
MAVGSEGGEFKVVLRATDQAAPTVTNFAEHTKRALDDTASHVNKQSGLISKSADEMGQNTSRIGERVAQIAKVVATAAAAAGTAGIAMLRNAINNADKLNEVSTKLGVSTEALSAWQYKAGQAGVKAEQLETALTAMSKAISKGDISGKSAAAKALDQLGLEADQLKKLGPDKAILAIADALENVPDRFDKVRIATDIFGKSGAGMIGVLEGGSKAFKESYAEAERFGQIIDTNTAKAADKFNDNVDKLSNALGGISTNVGKALIEPLAKVSEILVNLTSDTTKLKTISEAIIVVLKGMAAGLIAVGGIAAITGKTIGGVSSAIGSLISGDFKGAKEIIKEMAGDIADITKKSKELINEFFKPGKVSFVPPDSIAGMFRQVALSPALKAENMRAAFSASGAQGLPPGMYSDTAPGAELRTRDRTAEASANSARAQVELQLHNIEQLLKSQEQLVEESYRRRLQVIDNAEALGLEIAGGYDDARKQLKLQYEFDLSRIAEEGERSRYAMRERYNSMNLNAASFFFSQIGGLMQTKSRALFEIGKAGAIAETIISTYQGAQKAYTALVGIPIVGPALATAAAAAAVAVGFARVQAIRATNFGSASGSPVLTSGGTSGPVTTGGDGFAVPVAPASVQGIAAPRAREVNIYLSGEGSPTQSYIRDVLVPALNDALGDGAKLNVRRI